MKTSIRSIAVKVLLLTPAVAAASAGETSGSPLMMWLFLGFLGLVVVMQLVPGIALFIGMVKGLFGSARQNARIASAKGEKL